MRARFAVLCYVLLLATTFPTSAGAETAWSPELVNAWTSAVEQNRPLIVFFNTDDCLHCHRMHADTLADPRVSEQIQQHFVLVMLGRAEAIGLSDQLDLTIYPTTVVISPDSKLVARMDGYVRPEDFLLRLAESLPTQLAQQP